LSQNMVKKNDEERWVRSKDLTQQDLNGDAGRQCFLDERHFRHA
jgi:hypothetical protein